MKSSIHYFRLTYFPWKSKKLNLTLLLTLSLIIVFIYSCGSRYITDKINFQEKSKTTVIEKYKAKKYFILHDQQSDIHLYNVTLDENNKRISAYKSEISELHKYYKPIPGEKSHFYKKKMGDPKSEIHLYTSTNIATSENKTLNIPLEQIDSIIVHSADSGHEILKVVGITAGALVVATAIIAALKSSCPYVYSDNGSIFTFEGELYPGAVKPTMERDDYMQLKYIKETENIYTIKVSNELKEIQYTNSLQLLEVIHPENSKALIDQNGNIHTIQNSIAPFEMKVGNQISDPGIVENSDNISAHFNATSGNNEFQTVKLKFNRPLKKNQAKLILRLKNSYWLDYTIGKFHKKFGSTFNKFQKKTRNQPYKESLKWMKEQGIPLEVFIKQHGEWKLIESLNTVGPLEYRDLVVPINLNNNASQSLEIMLKCGFMFWEVDKVALDFSENSSITINKLKPIKAIDQNGNEVSKLLTLKDNKYLIQPNIGDQVYVSFKSNIKEKKDLKTTIFLENRGFYEYIRDYPGQAKKSELMTFKKPGALASFSKNNYFEFILGSQALEELASFDVAK